MRIASKLAHSHPMMMILRGGMFCVSSANFLLRLRLGAADDTAPFQYASLSRILGRLPFNGRWTIDSFVGRGQPCGTRKATIHQGFDPLPPYFLVSLLSSLSAPRVSTSRTPFTETPLIEVLSAELRPRHLVLHQQIAWGTRHHLRRSLLSDLDAERVVTAIQGPQNCTYSQHSVRIPSF